MPKHYKIKQIDYKKQFLKKASHHESVVINVPTILVYGNIKTKQNIFDTTMEVKVESKLWETILPVKQSFFSKSQYDYDYVYPEEEKHVVRVICGKYFNSHELDDIMSFFGNNYDMIAHSLVALLKRKLEEAEYIAVQKKKRQQILNNPFISDVKEQKFVEQYLKDINSIAHQLSISENELLQKSVRSQWVFWSPFAEKHEKKLGLR